MEEDLSKIKDLLLEYVGLILSEYPNSDRKNVMDAIRSGKEMVKFNNSDTISFFVNNGVLKLPQSAYTIFPLLKQYDNYGMNLNNRRNPKDYLNTNTTYMEYINHIIEAGLSEYDYFEESLLHETMHICGSRGGTPLEEGINELKTRELAQKYNIKIAAYGYSKEVEVAKRLQNIIGKEIMDELTFIPTNKRKDFLSIKVGNDEAELYESLSLRMCEKSNEYYNKIVQVENPFEKAQLYETIDYTEEYSLLDNYSKSLDNSNNSKTI